MNSRLTVSLTALVAVLAAGPAHARKVAIKAGTIAPEGSVWHNALLKLGQEWSAASKGDVTLKIYPGGVAGDEGDMIRKMRIGQLHMGSVTGISLGQITRATLALQVPMLIRSLDELDYVREQLGPRVAAEMEKNGFVVLNWGDAGWVHLFSKALAKTPDDFRKLKYQTWSEDPASEKAWRAARFQPVPLSSTDVLTGLKTDMIQAFGPRPCSRSARSGSGSRSTWSPSIGRRSTGPRSSRRISGRRSTPRFARS